MYFFGRSSTPKNAKANVINPWEARTAGFVSTTLPFKCPPYIFITAGNGPGPGGKKRVPLTRPCFKIVNPLTQSYIKIR